VTRIVPIKPGPPKAAPPAAEATPPAGGTIVNAAPAAPAATAEPLAAPAARPVLNTIPTPRAIIPPDVIKRLTASPKPKSAKPASASAPPPAGQK